MPELPEVETVRKGLAPWVEGKKIKNFTLHRSNLRSVIPADMPGKLIGKTIMQTERHGKTMVWRIEHGPDIAWHLGMSGSFRANAEKTPLNKHDHVEIVLEGGAQIVFNDPRRFGNLCYAPTEWQGLDPLTKSFTAAAFAAMVKGRKSPIKVLLLDQRLIAGIGNIYASEACFLAGLHPETPAGVVSSATIKALHAGVQKVLKDAIKSGGSSLRNHMTVDGATGYFQHRFTVYGRVGQPCRLCKTPIQKIVQTGRSTFFCPVCQAKNKRG